MAAPFLICFQCQSTKWLAHVSFNYTQRLLSHTNTLYEKARATQRARSPRMKDEAVSSSRDPLLPPRSSSPPPTLTPAARWNYLSQTSFPNCNCWSLRLWSHYLLHLFFLSLLLKFFARIPSLFDFILFLVPTACVWVMCWKIRACDVTPLRFLHSLITVSPFLPSFIIFYRLISFQI